MTFNSARDDLIETSDYVWQRFHGRIRGLGDDEYRWDPMPGKEFTKLPWRLGHIVDLLADDRNGPWLGLDPVPLAAGDRETAAGILLALDQAYDVWRGLLASTTEESLAEPIGTLAGPYGEATRRSYVLHVIDELVHHGAEAALLRDLYSAAMSR